LLTQVNCNLLITFKELATIKGCSSAAVSHAVRRGRISDAIVEKDGRRWLDRDLAIELWDKNTAKTHNSKVREADLIEPLPRDAGELEAAINKLPDDAIPELNESRARREHYQAELAKLQVTQQRGELVPVDEVKKEAFNIGRAVRESLSNLADRLSHQLAGEVDPVVIHKLLSDEHRAALLELTES
jgi:phage terminase Nu1 subunit (DNA packaging protein)